ncbi:CDP-glycerol glycerophosphotransferase family protein [Aciduricibacillus chroicocephali]|uniref:CDP-glycerol glycerophosphotransferase family protein n=1 Tax=Aciduricibacillus chroicocephali TaxID=3054939 RepID=A0ABY9KZB2_9BACI|nr:CDP-glycerol glycerophosphotransferase family protein [Bacillaceae bacterium 44XB]
MELKHRKKFARTIAFLKIMFAFACSIFTRRGTGRPIVLVGGNLGEKYEDNASVLHSYLTRERADLDVYWLYDPSTSYVQEKQIPNAIPLGSLRNYMLFFKADYSFHGHSIIYDIAPHIEKYIFLNRRTIITHVSHGIEGFKKILIQPEDIPLLKRTDYFNCASQHEKDIKQFEWKIPEQKLTITGMPRFDRFATNIPAKKVKRILMMMTWREWLLDLDEAAFMENSYFQQTQKLVSNPQIRQLIRDGELEIICALHPFMKRFESHFRGLAKDEPNIKFFSFNEISIQDEVILADMLLTDYTSVSWDFLYMNKPIIFFTFDLDEFVAKRGTYMDLNKDLYGYKADTIEEVQEILRHITAEGATTNPWYPIANKYIAYFDKHHCQRLADTIIGPAPQLSKPGVAMNKTVEET